MNEDRATPTELDELLSEKDEPYNWVQARAAGIDLDAVLADYPAGVPMSTIASASCHGDGETWSLLETWVH